MQFTIPQFIEKEPKIIGPFTFKQFTFIGLAGAICIFLYFTIPMFLFVIATIILLGGALALALLKIKKIPLPVIIKNFFIFLFKPKIYLWERKNFISKILKKEKKVKKLKETIKKESPLKLASGGKLKELFSKLETKK